MIEAVFKGGKKYWILVGVLLTVVTVGFLAYLRQLDLGLSVTGLSRDVSWGLYIANFTFFVGVAASAVMLVLPYYLQNEKAFRKIIIRGYHQELAEYDYFSEGLLIVQVVGYDQHDGGGGHAHEEGEVGDVKSP